MQDNYLELDINTLKSSTQEVVAGNLIPATRVASSVTVAHGVMVGIVALATFMRMADLGALPLNSAESSQALTAYNFLHNLPALSNSGSPAYFALSVLTQALLGSSDAMARLIPALLGSATVGLLWLLRPRLGTPAILITSLLLALSPLHIALSRTASGDSLALFSLLLLLVCALSPEWQPATRRTISALTLALGLTTSPLFYGGLLILLIAISIQRTNTAHSSSRLDPSQLQKAALIVSVTFISIATLFFSHPSGLGAAADQLAQMVMRFGFGRNTFTPLLAVLRYES
ncbi:MAG: glycosyltransferase family 39 protein, partial [Methylococcales bacterium]|nr:glycosyltransferase family 39 protein [Methylococcales bacterium]